MTLGHAHNLMFKPIMTSVHKGILIVEIVFPFAESK
jgi:hypothetical protein